MWLLSDFVSLLKTNEILRDSLFKLIDFSLIIFYQTVNTVLLVFQLDDLILQLFNARIFCQAVNVQLDYLLLQLLNVRIF